MSLINDALRRARQNQKKDPPEGARPLAPVESRPRGTGWLLAMTVGALVAAACFFFGLSLAKRTPPPVTSAPEPLAKEPAKPVSAPVTPSPAAPAVSPASLPEPKVAPAAEPASKPRLKVAVANPVVAANPPPVARATPAPPPEPKLQGIIFNPSRSWAIVNGKTVYAGDRVGDFRVKEISKNTVTLEKADGTRKVLELGR